MAIRRLALLTLVCGVAACTSTPPPDQMSRTAVETAPADLQLLCADAAAKAAGTDSTKILPVSSQKLDAQSYEVRLNANGRPMTCVVNTDGVIVSVA